MEGADKQYFTYSILHHCKRLIVIASSISLACYATQRHWATVSSKFCEYKDSGLNQDTHLVAGIFSSNLARQLECWDVILCHEKSCSSISKTSQLTHFHCWTMTVQTSVLWGQGAMGGLCQNRVTANRRHHAVTIWLQWQWRKLFGPFLFWLRDHLSNPSWTFFLIVIYGLFPRWTC